MTRPTLPTRVALGIAIALLVLAPPALAAGAQGSVAADAHAHAAAPFAPCPPGRVCATVYDPPAEADARASARVEARAGTQV
jgi:hypothetical protein